MQIEFAKEIFEKVLKKLSGLSRPNNVYLTDSKLKVINAFLFVARRLIRVPNKQMYQQSQRYLIWVMFIDRIRLGETRKTESELLPLFIDKKGDVGKKKIKKLKSKFGQCSSIGEVREKPLKLKSKLSSVSPETLCFVFRFVEIAIFAKH